MTTTSGAPRWGPFSKRPFLALLVGILAAAIVVTVMQVRPQSQAAEINKVQVTQHSAEASLKSGTTDTCVITSRATFQGDEKRVREFIESASKTARDKGMQVRTGGINPAPGLASTDLILSQEFDMTAQSIAPENCATAPTVENHRGRSALELPSWARGMVASAAAIAVYLAVVFSVTAIFAFLAPEFAIYGEIIGGCIGGFASNFVANYINRVPQSANLTSSAVQCVAGAILNVSLGAVKTRMVNALRAHVTGDLGAAVSEGISSHGSGHATEMSSEFSTWISQLDDELVGVAP